jgi:hypothetical protein
MHTLVTMRGIQECVHYIILLWSACAHYAMKGALQNDVKTTHHLKYTYITFTIGFGRGILQSPTLIYALSLVHHILIYNKISKSSKRCGYSVRIASSCSQVASSGLYQVHWTFTIPMVRFWSFLIFLSKMHTGCA